MGLRGLWLDGHYPPVSPCSIPTAWQVGGLCLWGWSSGLDLPQHCQLGQGCSTPWTEVTDQDGALCPPSFHPSLSIHPCWSPASTDPRLHQCRCHLPRSHVAVVLVALVLSNAIKAAPWPRVHRAAPALAVGQDPHWGAESGVLQPFADLPPKMLRAWQPLSLLVLLVLTATACGQDGTGPKELQPWLVGLTAVVVFLFIVFILLLVNRLWKLRMRRKQSGLQDSPWTSRLERTGCVNPAAEKDSGDESDGEGQKNATPL